ncbi:MAG: hypothetical protein KF817_07200 [Phycisphaeraceae bacterium]|nr:hypothetical protein [Phycisphaeraceae bacterium]
MSGSGQTGPAPDRVADTCPACGHRLTASGSPLCPECGLSLTVESMRAAAEHAAARRAACLLIVGWGLIAGAVVLVILFVPDRAIWIAPALILCAALVPVIAATALARGTSGHRIRGRS